MGIDSYSCSSLAHFESAESNELNLIAVSSYVCQPVIGHQTLIHTTIHAVVRPLCFPSDLHVTPHQISLVVVLRDIEDVLQHLCQNTAHLPARPDTGSDDVRSVHSEIL